MNTLTKSGITVSILAEDERYPLLIVEGSDNTAGYHIDPSTGDLRRVCICSAYSSSECVCGAWDIEDY